MNDAMFSSKRHDYETPLDFFALLNEQYFFDLDVCASSANTKCSNFFSVDDNGLEKEWYGTCWMNPPYGREIGKWVAKAASEAEKGITTVALLPARPDTKWFHQHIYGKHEIQFIKGRLKFVGAPSSAPFPSMLVIFRKEWKQ